MKLKAVIDEREREIEIKDFDGNPVFRLDGKDLEVEVSQPESDTFLLKSDNSVCEAFVEANADGALSVTVGTSQFDVSIIDPKRMTGSGAGAAGTDGAAEIRSAMPGKVVRLLVEVGDEVRKGEGIVVVEAMKMQNELKSPKDGVVKEILIQEEDRVNSGDTLAVIE